MRMSKNRQRLGSKPSLGTPTNTTSTTVVVEKSILDVIGQSSLDVYNAPALSVSGQPQSWSWQPRLISNAQDNTWQSNWNALPPVLRPYYGMALDGGVSKQLLREIYEKLEGRSPREGANLVNVMHENGAVCKIEEGKLVYIKKNPNGSTTKTNLANLRWPDAPTKVSSV